MNDDVTKMKLYANGRCSSPEKIEAVEKVKFGLQLQTGLANKMTDRHRPRHGRR